MPYRSNNNVLSSLAEHPHHPSFERCCPLIVITLIMMTPTWCQPVGILVRKSPPWMQLAHNTRKKWSPMFRSRRLNWINNAYEASFLNNNIQTETWCTWIASSTETSYSTSSGIKLIKEWLKVWHRTHHIKRSKKRRISQYPFSSCSRMPATRTAVVEAVSSDHMIGYRTWAWLLLSVRNPGLTGKTHSTTE